MFLSFKTWHRFEELLASTVLVVGARTEGDNEKNEQFRIELKKTYNCKGIILCGNKALEISSSYLRSIDNGLCERIFSYINDHLDLNRARHTFRVADYARRLAPENGVDSEKAYLAGLLHDCTKCEPAEWHLRYAEKHGFGLRREDLDCPRIIHQFTGALLANDYFGVSDPDILNAIRYHSTGRAGMSALEKLILFSDSCEPGRTYPGVSLLREKGEKKLDAGVFAYLNESVIHIIESGKTLHPLTVEARNYMLRS